MRRCALRQDGPTGGEVRRETQGLVTICTAQQGAMFAVASLGGAVRACARGVASPQRHRAAAACSGQASTSERRLHIATMAALGAEGSQGLADSFVGLAGFEER